MRVIRSVVAGTVIGVSVACGSAATAPSPDQLAGTWEGMQTVSRVTGNDCLVDRFSALIGNSGEFTIVMAQSGRTLSAMVGGCRYHGDVTNNLFTLDLDPASCDVTALGLICPDGSTRRDIRTRSNRLAGAVVGVSATGTSTETIDVLAAGTDRVVGAVVEEASFVIRKQ